MGCLSSSRSWIFLDRDGVINRDTGHVGTWDRFEFLPGAVNAMAELSAAGFPLCIVTNQSGIGRALYSELDYVRTTLRMIKVLRHAGAKVSIVAHCPHHPSAATHSYYRRICGCRKPSPGLLSAVAAVRAVCFERSFIIGDKPSDMEAGAAAGIPSSNRFICDGNSRLPQLVATLLARLDETCFGMLQRNTPIECGESTELMGDFMRKDKVEELIINLTEADMDAVGGGATLNNSTVTTQNWNRAMLLGCCTQGCCESPQLPMQ